MAGEQAVIVGVGMMTAVGLTAAETAASVRAATARFAATPMRDKQMRPFTLATVPDDGLPPLADAVDPHGLSAREIRLLRLATMPLRECLAPLGERDTAIGICLALPEAGDGERLDGTRVLRHLDAQLGGGVLDPRGSDATHHGRAGGLIAIGQAVAAIQHGVADLIVAGGVDSFADLLVLGMLDAEQRVKSSVNLDGFIPGEGAGFLLLASTRAAETRGLAALARLSPVAVGFETGHLYAAEPYRGDGLAATFALLGATGAAAAPVASVYSSMNGESFWAKEWGVAHARNRGLFDAASAMHHPADCFGDSGAACGPLMVGLATLGMQARYRRAPSLVYGSSDRGPRAALVVNASN